MKLQTEFGNPRHYGFGQDFLKDFQYFSVLLPWHQRFYMNQIL